jgi:glucose/arabinose dehydrogenase
MLRAIACWSCLAVAGLHACGNGEGPRGSVDTTLVVSPATLLIAVGDTARLAALRATSAGDTVALSASWTSRDTSVAAVSSAGLVRGVAAGVTQVVAAVDTVRDSAAVTVSAGPVAVPGLALITSQLASPVFLTTPPGDSTRLFVVEQGGQIRVIRNDTLLATPFLDLSSLVSTGGEQGLLSLAFHPGYQTNRYCYVSYTDTNGNSRIARYRTSANPDVADPLSASEILSVTQPYANHNGGLVAFGPDGKLYIGFGDGGSGGDPQGNGQNRNTLLGKLLRIDVDGGSPYAIPADNPFVGTGGVRGEIWAYGLRNPWRFSFDAVTGDLYIADVGQSAREEVDVQPAGSAGGANYGWNVMEGTICYGAASCSETGLTLPVTDYPHTNGACSITGGYVYRGQALPVLGGRYLYSDYCTGWVRSFSYVGGQASDARDWPALAVGSGVTSFGEDGRGNLYIMTQGGSLYRIVPQ